MNDGINKVLVFGSQILALVLVMTGTLLQREQLKSARPPGIRDQVVDSRTGDRYARLWQDPLERLAEFKTSEAAKETAETVAPATGSSPEQTSKLEVFRLGNLSMPFPKQAPLLNQLLNRGFEADLSRQYVFWNLVDGRPTPEAREVRLRARYAMVSTLAAAGYQPIFDTSLALLKNPASSDLRSAQGYLEVFERVTKDDRQRVYLAWVRQSSSYEPGETLPAIDHPDAVKTYLNLIGLGPLLSFDPTKIVIVHHGGSDQLRYFLHSGKAIATESERKRPFPQTFFVRATVAPHQLGYSEDRNDHSKVEELQAVVTDDELVRRLIGELKLRIPAFQAPDKAKRIIVFTESDSAYGRNFAQLLRDELRDLATIEVYSYLRGLDGLNEQEKPAGGAPDSGAKTLPTRASTEKSWGTSQYDYLTRLASKLQSNRNAGKPPIAAIGVLGSDVYDKLLVLQALNQELPGVPYFTTDLDSVYLNRDHLPYTRNLLIASGESLDPPNNQSVPDWELPPMRDSYQVALIKMVQGVLDTPWDDKWRPVRNDAGVWEVGTGVLLRLPEARTGDGWLKLVSYPWFNRGLFMLGLFNAFLILVAASARTSGEDGFPSRLRPAAYRFLLLQALISGGLLAVIAGLVFASALPSPGIVAVVSKGIAVVVLLVLGFRRMREKVRRSDRGWKPLLWDPVSIGALWLLAVLLSLSCVIGKTGGKFLFDEPLGLVTGTGIWPSVVLRLAAFLVGLLLLAFTSKIFVEQGREVRRDLGGAGHLPLEQPLQDTSLTLLRLFDAARPRIPNWLRNWFVFEPAKRHASAGDRSPSSTLNGCVMECFNSDRRVRRVILMAIVYFIFSVVLFSIWTPSVPARGGLTFFFEKFSISFGVGLYIIHLCFCVELHFCTYEIIRRITGALPDQNGTNFSPHISSRELTLIARGVGRLTRIVGFTLLYPLTILSLILLSRLRLFDDWTMTPSLVATLLIGVVVLVAVSIMIVLASLGCRGKVQQILARRVSDLEADLARQQIESARTTAEKNISEASRDLKKLSDEIDQLSKYQEGAFAPWYSQPIFVAILATVAIFGSLGAANPLLSWFLDGS
jgi:hypothetical protein